MANGDTLAKFMPQQNEPPVTAPATEITRNTTSPHHLLAFDGGTNESAIFKDVMLQAYGGGEITAFLHISHTSDNTGTNNTDWDLSLERIGDGIQDIDSDGFDTVNSINDTVTPTTLGDVQIISVVMANKDSIAKGELYRIKATRDAANDTSSTDAELHFIELRETS